MLANSRAVWNIMRKGHTEMLTALLQIRLVHQGRILMMIMLMIVLKSHCYPILLEGTLLSSTFCTGLGVLDVLMT